MAIEENQVVGALPTRNAYGRYIRERGTLKVIVAFVALVAVWYVYSAFRVNQLKAVHWPALQPDLQGLTVLGLQDKDRPGWRHKYEARESNHSWQIRYREDESGETSGESDGSETQDRGTDPGAVHGTHQGAVVPMEELLKNCPVVMLGRDFAGANVEEKSDPFLDRHYWVIHVDLTDEGQSRFWQFSRDHDQERLAFILKGEVLTCPRMSHMYTSTLTIDPVWIKADADRLADYINGQKR